MTCLFYPSNAILSISLAAFRQVLRRPFTSPLVLHHASSRGRHHHSHQLTNILLRLNSIFPHGEMRLLLLLLLRYPARIFLRQSSSDGSSLLWSEVEREIFLVLVEYP